MALGVELDDTIQLQIEKVFEIRAKSNLFTQYILNPSLKRSDVTFTLTALLGFLVARMILCGALRWPKLSRSLALLPRIFAPAIKPKRQLKFAENTWYFCWHLFSFCWGLRVLYLEGLTPSAPGWTRLLIADLDDRWYWFSTPAERAQFGMLSWPLLEVQPHLSTFYLTQLGFWLSCFCFVWVETMRKDFTVMSIHHFATCSLIGLSYIGSYWRCGLIVVVIHDCADIFLYFAKTLHYTVIKDFVVDMIFVIFVFVFCISRLIVYPIFCVLPLLGVAKFTKWTGGKLTSHWDVPAGVALPAFLFLLQILHVFWFCLILKMIYRTLFYKRAVNDMGDVRSDDEDEDDVPVPADHEKSEGLAKLRRRVADEAHAAAPPAPASAAQNPRRRARPAGGAPEEERAQQAATVTLSPTPPSKFEQFLPVAGAAPLPASV